MLICLVCTKQIPDSLHRSHKQYCINCSQMLDGQGIRFSCGSSLYPYKGIFRELILRAKVGGDQRLLRALVDLCLEHPYTKRELDYCEEVVPVPSSFSGRMRGSTDIAYFVARECAYRFGKRLSLAPFGGYWRCFKRSKQKQRVALRLNFPRRRDSIPTLLIDDVITTGYSLLQLAFKLEKSQCRFLTLGDAYSTREYQLE